MKILVALSVAAMAISTSAVSAQTAYSPFNNQRSVHNACWQALRIPPSRDYPTNPQHQRELEACKAAGGPDAYLRNRRGGQQQARSSVQQIRVECARELGAQPSPGRLGLSSAQMPAHAACVERRRSTGR